MESLQQPVIQPYVELNSIKHKFCTKITLYRFDLVIPFVLQLCFKKSFEFVGKCKSIKNEEHSAYRIYSTNRISLYLVHVIYSERELHAICSIHQFIS